MCAILGVVSAARKMTVEQWYELDEDDSRELVTGVLEEAEVPDSLHETVVAWLVVLLHTWANKRGGFAFASGLRFAVKRDTGRIPDVACYLRGRKPNHGLVRNPPDIAVEVLSPSTERTDRGKKMQMLARYGVPEYWLVDPDEQRVEIF